MWASALLRTSEMYRRDTRKQCDLICKTAVILLTRGEQPHWLPSAIQNALSAMVEVEWESAMTDFCRALGPLAEMGRLLLNAMKAEEKLWPAGTWHRIATLKLSELAALRNSRGKVAFFKTFTLFEREWTAKVDAARRDEVVVHFVLTPSVAAEVGKELWMSPLSPVQIGEVGSDAGTCTVELIGVHVQMLAERNILSARGVSVPVELLGDPLKGREFFRSSAGRGEATGQLAYGLCLYYGFGGKVDEAEAVQQFKIAADAGLAGGLCCYGEALNSGKGIARDCVAGARYLKLAAEKGLAYVQVEYGGAQANGPGDAENDAEAARLGELAHNYAMAVEEAGGDESGATLAYRIAASLNWHDSAYRYGVRLLDGVGCSEDRTEGARNVKIAAERGFARAQACYGYCLLEGTGVPRSAERLAEGARYLKMSAEQDDPEGLRGYAFCLRVGLGVQKNTAEASRILARVPRDAVALKERLAPEIEFHYRMATWLLHGNSVPMDESRAAKLFKLAADEGHAGAQNGLGVCLDLGIGVELDERAAMRCFRLAAGQNDADGTKNYFLSCCQA